VRDTIDVIIKISKGEGATLSEHTIREAFMCLNTLKNSGGIQLQNDINFLIWTIKSDYLLNEFGIGVA